MIDVGIPDTYADDLIEVQDLGACVRFIYCSFTATADQLVVAKIVRPKTYYHAGKSGLLLAAGPRLTIPQLLSAN